MASAKQKKAAKRNIKKALAKWKSMTSRARALAQPQGRARKKPGTTGKGKYYRIVVRPKSEFTSFRMHDVGRKGHIIRLAGRRKSGKLRTKPKKIRGDVFEAKSRKNVPEKAKPTAAMKKAQKKNIKKAQAARWKKKK